MELNKTCLNKADEQLQDLLRSTKEEERLKIIVILATKRKQEPPTDPSQCSDRTSWEKALLSKRKSELYCNWTEKLESLGLNVSSSTTINIGRVEGTASQIVKTLEWPIIVHATTLDQGCEDLLLKVPV